MLVLFIGDIVGKPGREAVRVVLPDLIKTLCIDVVMANAENIAHGTGATPPLIKKLEAEGVHLFSLGNHAWRHPEMIKGIDALPSVARPANFSTHAPGKGRAVYTLPDGRHCTLINLIGRVFMEPANCPFDAIERELDSRTGDSPFIFVDVHAEATSEKAALAWHLDGRCSAVLGTHTHVQTADERILPGGTAFISDVGMCGPYNSILGVKSELVLKKSITGLPVKWEIADGPVQFNAVLVETDDRTGRAISVKRIQQILQLDS
ncbi:MAG TPA: TIGR00282 family metallophosphoesterase [Candidatus Hydrogenedentes bacterium]|jgi:hypothetical protein|nr:MAG: hypothetical protein BWY07_01961 [Candidatus Hydrogenedentes bacterium ADurb.Bin170]HNZ47452.1 TIGR00282 family metallophosphoesterase [Candidatus Hydrogenedentota bacterium]HOD94682.1 TIGR00282 family metallophosphoesterase [Candidatus Hydrogenedentota bacterium]HOM48131.1 TIGR00282 family metallophosphoesterase [Candidatus Hydrogenedentota bacterium]HOR50193.1 TIGR00282 family metallophosphoesterase [Candidatus Hydrogenedentota bacterium]